MNTRANAEPELLTRLRRSLEQTGLVADLESLDSPDQVPTVTNNLAQTTLRYLLSVDADAGERMSDELSGLLGADQFSLLMEDTGYTFLHVVQYLYEYSKHHAKISESQYFCAGMGRGGGGIEVAPNEEVLSLILLMMTALPAEGDSHGIKSLFETFGPIILGNVFPVGKFEFDHPSDRAMRITLRYSDPEAMKSSLHPLGLKADIGTFFLNSALHIEGVIQLGLDIIIKDAPRSVTVSGLIGDGDDADRQSLQDACSCTWDISWVPEVGLNKLGEADKILAQGRTIYEAFLRRDLQYHQQRIASLELQVRSLEQREQYRELEQELQTAHTLQMGLMPKEIPSARGMDLAGRCLPANHVGGDFFKFFRRTEGRLTGVLADVSGHAMEAAIPLLVFSGILESQMEMGGSVGDIIDRLNKLLCRTLTGRSFVCLLMGELDRKRGRLTISNCGCPYPYHFRAATQQISEIELDGYPLGISPTATFGVLETHVEPGDWVTFCSDGIIEARNKDDEPFGFERTADVISQGCMAQSSASALIDHVLQQVLDFTEGVPLADDQSIVVLRAQQ